MKRTVSKQFRIYDRVFQIGEVFTFDQSRGKIEIGDRIMYVDYSDIRVVLGCSDVGLNMVKELRDNGWRAFEHHDNWIKNEHYPNPTFEQQFDTGNAYKEMLKTKI